MDEQREIRMRERIEHDAAAKGVGHLGSVNLDLSTSALATAALELVRRGDEIALRYLLNEAIGRARELVNRRATSVELNDLLDQLTCIAAAFITYKQDAPLKSVIETIVRIYSMPIDETKARRFAFSTAINPDEIGPRIWLQVIERVYALGALSVRLEDWKTVKLLTLQRPRRLGDYERNWLRHALTMASRAQHLSEQRGTRTIQVSLLSLAHSDIGRLECLRQDDLGLEDDELISSLAQFDVLANIVAVDDSGDITGRDFYTNFARLYSHRIYARRTTPFDR